MSETWFLHWKKDFVREIIKLLCSRTACLVLIMPSNFLGEISTVCSQALSSTLVGEFFVSWKILHAFLKCGWIRVFSLIKGFWENNVLFYMERIKRVCTREFWSLSEYLGTDDNLFQMFGEHNHIAQDTFNDNVIFFIRCGKRSC